ncbi:S8 family serine peptidase [Paenarthrobacter sp. Z7-10]|uniref:S8 family serine peptidase n=1 Tax=Paenarthrobacter sp. Z7-10 TaxID=2787635 RepID=UPI0022A8DE2B|nr:S8 family serine peptidase [Paenarthrobacter sp. Z7-10]MCZ2404412.1 S8 family serine peptidase [Paenarthrobacter sp. Z7-10]
MRVLTRVRPAAAGVLAVGLLLGSSVVGLASAPAASADDIRNREYWLEDYGIAKAWDVSKGAGVKVAIIDSGVDGTHQDLKGAVVGGTDVSGSGSANGQKGIGSEPVHGTLVASLLAGRGHAGSSASASASGKASASAKASRAGAGPDGVIGVAPEAQLLSVSAWLGSPNPSGKSIDEQIPDAVHWAVDHGAKVINMSLGSTSTAWPQSWDEAFLYAEQQDVVIVAAAGNRATGSAQVGAPATIPGVLAVGGLNYDGTASKDSSSQGITIGVSAPAEKLVGGLPGGGYADWSGTSGAAPIVSGVAALIRSRYPDMSAAQVINRIISTAKPAGSPRPNAIYGYGLLDAEAALTANVAPVKANPLGNIADWIRIHRRGAVPTPPTQPPAPPSAAGPSLPEPTAPVALPPSKLDSALPMALVLGFSGLLLLLVAAGSVHVLVARRRLREGEPESNPSASGNS